MPTVLTALAISAIDGNGQALPPDRYALAFKTAPSSVRLTPDRREILVEFPSALPDGDADRVAKALGPLLEGYAEGYGVVRFRLTTPSHTALAGRSVVITPDPEPVATIDDQRRLAMLEARAEARKGNLDAARVQLRQLAAAEPQSMEPQLTLADVETGAGRWQHALGLYDGVLRLFPQATDVTRDRDALSVSHAPSIRTDATATFGPNGERGQTVTLTADVPLSERWRAGASLQTSHDAITGLRRPFSSTTENYSQIKTLASANLAYDWERAGDTTRVSVFGAPATVGAELRQTFETRLGSTSLGGQYHQPYWGTVMAFAANARRDQVGVAQTVKLPARWEVQVGAGLVRYGIPGHDGVASGPSALAGLSKGLPAAWLPWPDMDLRIGYRLEAEYLSHVETAPTSLGPLSLLDVRSREIHSFYAEASASAGPGIATAELGYAIDRYGGGGPQVLLRYVSGQDTDRLVFAAEAGVEPSLDIKPRTLFHIGGYSIWRFGGA